ncbi:hypothetical protein Tco_0446085 [Tanacetum coccineum]
MSSQEQPSQVPITEPITDSFTTSHPTQTPSLMPYDSPTSGALKTGIYDPMQMHQEKDRVKTHTRRRSTDSSRDSTVVDLFSTGKEVQGKEQISTDEKVAQKINDQEMAREEQEMTDFEKALELQKQRLKKTKTKRIAEETLLQESFKKLRTAEASRSEPIQEQPTEEPKELSEEELKKMLEIVPAEEAKIIRDRILVKKALSKSFKVMAIRIDTGMGRPWFTLWSLVKERFRSTEPIEDKERTLWVELKRLFEPDKNDVL